MDINEFSFALKPSNIEGVGVFATHDIPEGTIIHFYPEDFEDREMKKEDIPIEFLKFCIATPNDIWLCPQDFGRMRVDWYINHSFQPNLKWVKRAAKTIKTIRKGEELTVDYNDFDEPHDAKEIYYKKLFLPCSPTQ